MLGRLIILMTVVPAIELVLLVQVHQWLADRFGSTNALFLTIGSIVFTGVVGANLARAQGFSVIRNLQNATAEGKMPADELMDGFMILVGGALLLTPGFLTDVFGFSLLLPFSRGFYRDMIRSAVMRGVKSGSVNFQFHAAGFPPQEPRHGETIDAEYIEPKS